MLINFPCRQYRVIFDSEVGEITMPGEAARARFEQPIVCPRCRQLSLDEVWLTEAGQSQMTAAMLPA